MVRALPVGFAIALIGCFFRYKNVLKKQTVFIGVALTYVIGVLDITGMFSGNTMDVELFLQSIKNISMPFSNADAGMLILNFFLFVPLGMIGCLVFRSEYKNAKSILVCCLLSILIEITQGFNGRFLEIDDVIMNTLGGIIGTISYRILKKVNITLPKKEEISIFFFSALVFVSMGFVMENFYDDAKENVVNNNYIYVFDKYDSDTSSIMDLYAQSDSLKRLEQCDMEMENYFENRMEIFSTQQLESCENSENYMNAIQIEKNTYKLKKIDSLLIEGSGIEEFEYDSSECPILLSENMKSEYEIGEEFKMCYLGDIILNCKVFGFLDASKMIEFGNNYYNTSDYAIMPLFDEVTKTDLDFLNKQIIVTDRLESVISYETVEDREKVLNKINDLSEKYDLKLSTIDTNMQNAVSYSGLPIYISVASFVISIALYCISVYKRRNNVSRKSEILNIIFWQMIIGYIWIMLKSGIHDSGNVILSTAIGLSIIILVDGLILLKRQTKGIENL